MNQSVDLEHLILLVVAVHPFWHHAMVSSIPLLMPNEDKEGHFKVNKQILSHKNLRTTQMVAGSILLWL